MIVVTGAYGFIGSHFVKYLNKIGRTDIVVVDYLTNGRQFKNLAGASYAEMALPDRLLEHLKESKPKVERVFHFGAISDTTCWDGELVLKRNTQYTLDLISLCDYHKIPVSYSSSASVYGNGSGPLNLYAYSKWLVDDYITSARPKQVQGFRYFNVYATDDSEWHKGKQASPFYQFKQQALDTGRIEIFEGSADFKRDFVHVDRVCEHQWAMSLRKDFGVFDLGSGQQMSFEDVAHHVALLHSAEVVTVPFPEHLKGHYQTNTRADMSYC